MEALGAYLKKNREQRGVSLEELAANTKINISVLLYLEEDRFDKLPSAVFVKGFIRSYLNYLGMNPKEAILFYELMTGQADVKPRVLSPVTEQKNGASHNERVYNIRLSHKNMVLIFATLGFLLLTSMYFIIFPSSDTKDGMSEYRKSMLLRMAPQPQAQAQIQPQAQPQPQPQVEVKVEPAVVQPPAPVTSTTSVTTTTVEVQPVQKPQSVLIKDTQDVWVKVQIDNKKPFDFLLRKGNTKKVEAKDEIKVLLGDAAGATVEYNGETLNDLGQKGNTRSIVFPGLGRWKDALVQ